jgi:2-polyprenyl-3-methyl-5-hydroxy-6-metoxy-1,4-benzoquinol methylase
VSSYCELNQEEMRFQQNRYEDPNPTRWYLHNNRKNWILDKLNCYVAEGTKVLEIGVGCGIFTRWLHHQGAIVTATDVNQTFLQNIANVDGIRVVCGDATEDLGFRGFEVLLCSEVIEHVDPARSQIFLSRMYESLGPNAVAIISTPQRYSTVELLARLFKYPAILWLAKAIYGTAEELGHINLLTRAEFERQIRNAGFEIEQTDLMGLYIPVIAEIGGKFGANFQYRLSNIVRNIPVLKNLLWTQAYVLRKPQR